MVELCSRDIRALHHFLHGGQEVRDLPGFTEHVLGGLPQLVACDALGYNEVDLTRRHLEVIMRPREVLTPAIAEAFQRFAAQHPVIEYQARTGDTRPMAVSDFLSRREFERLEVYQHGFRPMGVDQVIAFGLPAEPPTQIGIALARAGRQFTARECSILEFLRPHLAHMYRAVAAQLELERLRAALEAGDRAGSGVVLFRRGGPIELVSAEAQRRLRDALGVRLVVGDPLPLALQRWLDDGGQRPRTLRLDGARGAITVRLLVARQAPRCDALVVAVDATRLSVGALCRLGLSRREADVLLWVSRGKTNGEIAQILGSSARTVEKHLEHVYAKLGVTSRTAAVTGALERLAATG